MHVQSDEHATRVPNNPDRFIDDEATADLLGLSRSYLRQLRVRGGGPRFSSFGRAVRYRTGDLLEWAAAHSKTSTSAAA
jgi:predicted DNA-binding transcriptional regulator AlpA